MENTAQPVTATSSVTTDKSGPLLVYILFAIGFFVGITFLVGGIIAQIRKGTVTDPLLLSHYQFQTRTFWYSVLWSVIGILTWAIVIGWIVLGINFIWTLYRVVKGFIYLQDGKTL